MTLDAEVSFDAFGKELGLFGVGLGSLVTLFKRRIATGAFRFKEICYLLRKFVNCRFSPAFYIVPKKIHSWTLQGLFKHLFHSAHQLGEIMIKVTFHLTISMRGQLATGKIQRINYHDESCGPSLTLKNLRCFLKR